MIIIIIKVFQLIIMKHIAKFFLIWNIIIENIHFLYTVTKLDNLTVKIAYYILFILEIKFNTYRLKRFTGCYSQNYMILIDKAF